MKESEYINGIDSINEMMVEIPKGEIVLRDDRINEKWKVIIQPFLLSKYLVTQELYELITQQNPSASKGKNKPVECVSWLDSVKFCNLLSGKLGLTPYYKVDDELDDFIIDTTANGYRLPSEAEWEYACKAGSADIRYGDTDKIAWYKLNANGHTHDIGSKEANNWGVYDMLGNVWEWCSDKYDETVYGTYRIFRGGGWNDEERGCLATNRRRSHPTAFKIDDLGFRLAKNLY